MAGKKSNKREKGATRHRLFEGKIVRPVMYYGSRVGNGNFMAAMINKGEKWEMVEVNGKPIPFRSLPLEPKTKTLI